MLYSYEPKPSLQRRLPQTRRSRQLRRLEGSRGRSPRLLGFVTKPEYDGVSEDDSEDTGSDMSDADDPLKTTPAKTAEIDSDAVDYDESDDDDKPQSGSDEDSSGDSDSAIKRKDQFVIRPFNRRDARQAR
ncbi:hypothetical protein PHYSODRAFT_249994 [Phytophthora sojae]|uniref:Uncharacterized protein n=1 Tax=Phytophthora sojae (strain P6497) TaxID=1094619 RepID=G5ACB6_PHYSP|nr:hypothetical protein PHYSODRAFT_249994 [Phytophthora sojae]EGZ06990.1 hypothetical protein PHYSODRAFT_249994 [Phytophthora sojae]|eukprot:XP_009537754.1 hypothetical protein PHYSODRAFT_249994 [Phytophthora sojae]